MMKVRHFVPMALMLFSVTACATASGGQINANDIKARVIGNTVTGVDDGKPYQEYYNPNGTVSGMDTEDYTGSWRIEGNKLCTGYESDDPKKPGVEFISENKRELGWDWQSVVRGDNAMMQQTLQTASLAALLTLVETFPGRGSHLFRSQHVAC